MALIKRLASNFIEIAHADEPFKQLVAFRGRIYHSSYWLGKLVKSVYFIAGRFTRIDQNQKLQSAIDKSRKLFFKKIDQLELAEPVLRKGLKRKILRKKFEDARYSRCKDHLLSFITAFEPLMSLVRKGKERKILEILTADVEDPKDAEEIKTYLEGLFHDLQFYQKVYDFEYATGTEIPFDLIKKMSLGKQLKIREERSVRSWIEAIRKSEGRQIASFYGAEENLFIRVRFLHRLLCLIVDFINEVSDEKEEMAQIELLEAHLTSLGFKMHEQADYKQIAYRRKLKTDETIVWGDKEIVLGEILENPEMDPALPVVFAVKNDPNIEVVAYKNESWTYIERFQEGILHCGVPGKAIFGVSDFGQVVVRERLYHPLASIKWTSRGSLIGRKDKILAEPIVDLLSQLKELPFTPHPLEPQNFAYNNDNTMRAAVCLVPGQYSFEALENMAYLSSIGRNAEDFNPAVFTHLMVQSCLGTTKEAKRYQQLFVDALNDEDPELSVSLNSSITSPDLLERREEFFDTVQQIFEECYEEISEKYFVEDDKKLKKALKCELYKYYQKSCPGSILIPKLPEKAIFFTLKRCKLKMKKDQFNITMGEVDEAVQQDEAWGSKKQIYHRGIFHPDQVKCLLKKAEGVRKARRKKAA